MKVVFYLNVVSPHQLPLANEIVKQIGENEFRYVYQERSMDERVQMGWGEGQLPHWCVPYAGNEDLVLAADLLYVGGMRPIDLIEKRAKAGKITVYPTERWFKPVSICRVFGLFDCSISGWVRMLFPSYRKMARRFMRWLNDDPNARCLVIGPWAAKDMRRLGVRREKIVPWGYFVEPSTHSDIRTFNHSNIKLLWVGRLLALKRVDDIVRAVREHVSCKRKDDTLPNVTLDIYGSGVEEPKLRQMVAKYGLGDLIKFHPSVPIAEVRQLMREHDVYILSSNAYEGWGAVVSEALEEGMKVIGTHEAGACAAILPETNLYHAGDWRRLAELIRSDLPVVPIGEWTAANAAKRLLEMM